MRRRPAIGESGRALVLALGACGGGKKSGGTTGPSGTTFPQLKVVWGTTDYLDPGLFARHGIEVEWERFAHPAYPQQHGEFVPFMSALDLILIVDHLSGQ